MKLEKIDTKWIKENSRDYALDVMNKIKSGITRRRSWKCRLEQAYFIGYVNALQDVRDGLVVVDET